MAEYCLLADLGRYGVNAKAIEDLSTTEQQTPPIQAASDLMDGYFASRFTLPLIEPYSKDIVECCAVIAAWTVLSVRGLKPGENPEDNVLLTNYNAKIRWLENIAKGLITPRVKDSSTEAIGVSPARPFFQSNEQRGHQTDFGGAALPFQGRRR